MNHLYSLTRYFKFNFTGVSQLSSTLIQSFAYSTPKQNYYYHPHEETDDNKKDEVTQLCIVDSKGLVCADALNHCALGSAVRYYVCSTVLW